MNIPDGAVYSLGGTIALFSLWALRAFSQQQYRLNKAQDESDLRQKRRDEIEAEYQQRQKLLDIRDEFSQGGAVGEPGSSPILSVKDWRVIVSEMERMFKVSFAELRAELAKNRSDDKDELRAWINGSFMRAPVVAAKLESIELRLLRIEEHQDAGGG